MIGKDEKKLCDIAKQTGMPLPESIRDAPDLLPGLDLYYEAFQRLTTSRAFGMGAVGPIPYSAISGYCKDEGFVGEERSDIFYHVERLDAAYMEWQTAKLKESTPKS